MCDFELKLWINRLYYYNMFMDLKCFGFVVYLIYSKWYIILRYGKKNLRYKKWYDMYKIMGWVFLFYDIYNFN